MITDVQESIRLLQCSLEQLGHLPGSIDGT